MTDDQPPPQTPEPTPQAPPTPPAPQASLAPRPLLTLPMWPAPPPKKRWRPRQSAFFALLAVVALACSSGGFLMGHAGSAHTGPPPANLSGTASAAPVPNPPAGDADGGKALLARIVSAPHGSRKVDIGGNGVFDLSDFEDHNFPDDRAELARMRARQFEWMAERGWVTAKGVEYHIELVEFAADDGADSLLKAREFSNQQGDANSASFPVSGLVNAMGYERKETVGGQHVAVLYGRQGNVDVAVFVYVKGPVDRDAASALLRTQVVALLG